MKRKKEKTKKKKIIFCFHSLFHFILVLSLSPSLSFRSLTSFLTVVSSSAEKARTSEE